MGQSIGSGMIHILPWHSHQNTSTGIQVAVIPLLGLLEAASRDENAGFEVVAVVSQPPRSRGRGKKAPQPSPVHQAALAANIPESAILTPAKARDVRRSLQVGHAFQHTLPLHCCSPHSPTPLMHVFSRT